MGPVGCATVTCPLPAVGMAGRHARLGGIEASLAKRHQITRIGELHSPERETRLELRTLSAKALGGRRRADEQQFELLGCDQPSQAENVGCEVWS